MQQTHHICTFATIQECEVGRELMRTVLDKQKIWNTKNIDVIQNRISQHESFEAWEELIVAYKALWEHLGETWK